MSKEPAEEESRKLEVVIVFDVSYPCSDDILDKLESCINNILYDYIDGYNIESRYIG